MTTPDPSKTLVQRAPEVAGTDLSGFFDDWIFRASAWLPGILPTIFFFAMLLDSGPVRTNITACFSFSGHHAIDVRFLSRVSILPICLLRFRIRQVSGLRLCAQSEARSVEPRSRPH